MKHTFLVIFGLALSLTVMAEEPEYRSKNYPDGGGLMYDGYFIGDKPVEITRYTEGGHIRSYQKFDSEGNSTIKIYTSTATPFADGAYKGKNRDGKWQFYSTHDGTLLITVTYNNGIKDGFAEFFFPSGKLMETVNYKNDTLDGERVQYFENGQKLAVIHYKNGVLDGEYKSFIDTGEPDSEGNFVNGKRDGVWKFYDEKGAAKEYKFKNGRCKKYEDMLKKADMESEIDPHIPEPDMDKVMP